jgi:hypothetical protein
VKYKILFGLLIFIVLVQIELMNQPLKASNEIVIPESVFTFDPDKDYSCTFEESYTRSTTTTAYKSTSSNAIKTSIPAPSSEPDPRPKVTVFKSKASCRCCDKYFDYLEGYGFNVEVVETKEMDAIRTKYQIPHELGSCHTAIIDDYFVEGHPPIEAIRKLLSERPTIDGITLPGEPPGSPGMRGAKTKEFTIYALSDGEESVFYVY